MIYLIDDLRGLYIHSRHASETPVRNCSILGLFWVYFDELFAFKTKNFVFKTKNFVLKQIDNFNPAVAEGTHR